MPGLTRLLMILFVGCSLAHQDQKGRLSVIELESPAGAGSQTPNLSTRAGRTYLSWLRQVPSGDFALQFSEWNGKTWGAAKGAESGSRLLANWADFPSIIPLENGKIAAHWLLRSEARSAYDVMISQSIDGGDSWSAAVRPHHDGTPTEHGFVTLLDQGTGRLGAIWLDGRNYHESTGRRATHEMSLMYSSLQEGIFQAETTLDPRVCDCCQTDAAVTSEGLFVAYRDRSPSEVRDISYVRYVGGKWTEPKTLHNDGWTIAACPVNGPAVAAQGNRVAVAWYTLAPEPKVQVTFSGDGGNSFGPPVRIDEGQPIGRVDLVWQDDGSVLASWLEKKEGNSADICLRRITGAKIKEPVVVAAHTSSGRLSGFPRMTTTGSGALIAWTDVAEPMRVRVAKVH